MRVLCCGGRDYDDRDTVEAIIDGLVFGADGDIVIITGGARGVDTLAHEVALDLGLATEVYPAYWNVHGKAAGFIRNQQMLDSGVDLVVAFPGGRGTADMVRRAREANVRVLEVHPARQEVS